MAASPRSVFHGIFVRPPPRRQRSIAARPTSHGDRDATLYSLALAAVVRSVDEATADASLQELKETVEALATWPPCSLEWTIPKLNARLLMAARDAGLQPDEARHRGMSKVGSAEMSSELLVDMSSEALLRRLATSRTLDRAIRREELAYRQWRAECHQQHAELPPPSPVTAAWALVDVFSDFGVWLSRSEPPSLPRSQLIFAHERDARVPSAHGTPVFEPTLASFEKNWDAFSRGILAGLDWSGLVAAGGAVTACVLRSRVTALSDQGHPPSEDALDDARWRWFEPLHEGFRRMGTTKGDDHRPECVSPFSTSSDIDLFLVGSPTAEAALATVGRIHRTLKRNFRGKVLCARTGSALTFVAGGYPTRFVQVVLKLFPSAADVLSSFDVDCCGFAYDGTRVLATPRAVRAVVTRVNLIDLERRSLTYESRVRAAIQPGPPCLHQAVDGVDGVDAVDPMHAVTPVQPQGYSSMLVVASPSAPTLACSIDRASTPRSLRRRRSCVTRATTPPTATSTATRVWIIIRRRIQASHGKASPVSSLPSGSQSRRSCSQ